MRTSLVYGRSVTRRFREKVKEWSVGNNLAKLLVDDDIVVQGKPLSEASTGALASHASSIDALVLCFYFKPQVH